MTRTQTKASGTDHRSPSLLMHLVITLLAPMFLGVSDGNVHFARMAAIETVNDYRARNNADLVAVAQIIAFGLAALGSLSLSLADDISITMALKLRGNANACHRSAEQNRRALRLSPIDSVPLEIPPELWTADDTTPFEPEPLLTEPLMTPEAAEVLAVDCLNEPDQAATETPSSDAPTATPQNVPDKCYPEMWAIAMVQEASEITASLANLPPAEREAAVKRAATLGNIAHNMLSGGPLPPPEPGANRAQPLTGDTAGL